MQTLKLTYSNWENETTKAIRLPEFYDEEILEKLIYIMWAWIIKEITK